MSFFERGLPVALAIFCGVTGGWYTFQPYFANKQPLQQSTQPGGTTTTLSKPDPPAQPPK